MPVDRRGLLATGSAAAIGLAGCSSLLPGGGTRYGTVDAPAGGPPEYRRWITTDEAFEPHFEGDDREPLRYGRPGADEARLGRRFGVSDGLFLRGLEAVGVGYTDYDEVVVNGGAVVGLGAFDRATVHAALRATGYDRTDSHRGFDLYARSDEPRALAVGDGAVVTAPLFHETDAVETALGRVRTTVDAGRGAVPRRHEADDDFETATDRAGARPTVSFGAPLDVGDPVAGTVSFTFDSDTVYAVLDQLYRSESARPSRSALKDRLENGRLTLLTDPDRVAVAVDGRAATLSFQQDAATLLESAPRERPPLVTWGVDYDPDRRRLTFVHEAGDEIFAPRLRIAPADGFEAEDPFEQYDTFSPGDTVTLTLTDGAADDYSIDWVPPGRDSGTTLFHYHLPR